MKRQSGFTLIEIMIALVILAVGLTGLLGFATYTIRAADDNEKWTTARMIAAATQEELSARNFDALQTMAGSATSYTGTNTVYANSATYSVTWTLDRNGTLSSDPLEVRVEVSFSGMLGPPVRLRTFRYTLL